MTVARHRPRGRPIRRAAAWLLALPLVLLVALAAAVALYAAVAFALPLLPARGAATGEPVAVEAFVISNGAHTDLVFPIRSASMDWTQTFGPAEFAPPPDATHVAIGWGDREFYLHTPRWRDITAGRALSALSGAGGTLLHVTWLTPADLRVRTWRVPLTARQHASLVAHVTSTLADVPAQALPGVRYGPRDAFFEARGAYDALTTCNTWTGRGLRDAGVPVSRWTPFAANVVAHLVPVGAPPPPP